ncbi:hypothetical protein WISP_66491 [Willisornis vidua]|uniref:Uncharacterized protein n=1 Tax=Willisornis vidua TaxID=1566151 RepID=A0ABQ9DDJ7_9PASS|nr:hypothetical protein WISP_66491 [Willisornis vidua]
MAQEERAGTDAQEVPSGGRTSLLCSNQALNRDQGGFGVSSLGVFPTIWTQSMCSGMVLLEKEGGTSDPCGPFLPDPSHDSVSRIPAGQVRPRNTRSEGFDKLMINEPPSSDFVRDITLCNTADRHPAMKPQTENKEPKSPCCDLSTFPWSWYTLGVSLPYCTGQQESSEVICLCEHTIICGAGELALFVQGDPLPLEYAIPNDRTTCNYPERMGFTFLRTDELSALQVSTYILKKRPSTDTTIYRGKNEGNGVRTEFLVWEWIFSTPQRSPQATDPV